MDDAIFRKLNRRALDCLDAALVSLERGRADQVHDPLRTARDILDYIATKQALDFPAGGDAPAFVLGKQSDSRERPADFPRHD